MQCACACNASMWVAERHLHLCNSPKHWIIPISLLPSMQPYQHQPYQHLFNQKLTGGVSKSDVQLYCDLVRNFKLSRCLCLWYLSHDFVWHPPCDSIGGGQMVNHRNPCDGCFYSMHADLQQSTTADLPFGPASLGCYPKLLFDIAVLQRIVISCIHNRSLQSGLLRQMQCSMLIQMRLCVQQIVAHPAVHDVHDGFW